MDPSKPFNEAQIGPRPFQFFNQLAHINVSTGLIKTWFADDQSCFQEPIFVPKSADAAEGEGYVIALRNRLLEQATDQLIPDAQHLDEGPIATVKLPIRLRMSLHGNWVPSSAVRAG